jgi:hypothetical protein
MAGAAARRDSLMSPRVAVLGCLSLSLLGLLALGTPRIAHARRGDADGIHLTVVGLGRALLPGPCAPCG